MKKLMSVATLSITGLVTVGLLALPTTASANDELAKREEDGVDLVLMDDDDDDDTNEDTNDDDDTNGDTNSGTGNSNDNTGSRYTGVSRDSDNSRGDQTKDWTRDGGDRTRDRSANQTNDRSRNDTRR
jgi:hypothetical protein